MEADSLGYGQIHSPGGFTRDQNMSSKSRNGPPTGNDSDPMGYNRPGSRLGDSYTGQDEG